MPHPNGPLIVRHPSLPGALANLDPSVGYDEDHELVKAYPWAFTPLPTSPGVVESVGVETATAAPGERRNVRRPGRS